MNMKRPGYRGTAPMWTAAQALVELADTELGGGYYLAERAETGKLKRYKPGCRIAALEMVADGAAAQLTPRDKGGIVLHVDFMWVSCTGAIWLWSETSDGRPSTPEQLPLLRLEPPPDSPEFKLAMEPILTQLGTRPMPESMAADVQLGWDQWAMKLSHRLSQTGLSHVVRDSEWTATLVFRNGQRLSLGVDRRRLFGLGLSFNVG